MSDADKAVYGNYINTATKELIENWYSNSEHANCYADWDCTQRVSSSYVIPHEATPYMNCLNEWRRWETSFEGLRFLDLKRWGRTITHEMRGHDAPIVLEPGDPRLAIEVPWEAQSAGMASSRGASTAASNANITLFDAKQYKTK